MRMIMFFLFLGLQLSAQDMALRKGVVMDSIPVNDSISESFAIYIPTTFRNNERALPVLFIFDSEGRGRQTAQLLKPAAEEQQYIIVSSNDLKTDNSFEENTKIASRLISEVTSRIPVDLKMVSVAGYSEGARVASSIPLIFNNIHGVIAIGGPIAVLEYLEKANRFVFVGIAGDEEFASYTMQTNANVLGRAGFPAEVYIYDGGHRWPDPDILGSSLGTLTLQAMKSRKRALDQNLINSLYERDLGLVNKMLGSGNYYRAYNLLEQMESKYSGLHDTSQIKEKQRQVRRSRNYREQQREIEKAMEKENRLIEDFLYYFNEDVATANFENLGWWNYQQLQLKELAAGDDEAEADMASRLLGMLDQLAEAKRVELRNAPAATLESRLLANMIQTIFDDRDFEAYKNIISLSAQDGDFGTALFYLEEMLKHGYDNMEELYDLEGTLALRMTYDYNWLINKYIGTSRYYDAMTE